MNRSILGFLIVLIALTGCSEDDDPTCTCPEPVAEWTRAMLPTEVENGVVSALASRAGRTVALARDMDARSWVSEYSVGEWLLVGDEPLPYTFLPPDAPRAPAIRVALDITIDGQGRAQAVGYLPDVLTPSIWSETTEGWSLTEGAVGYGVLRAVVPLGAESTLSVGWGEVGAPEVISTPGVGTEFGYATIPDDSRKMSLLELATNGDRIFGVANVNEAAGTLEEPLRLVLEYSAGSWSVLPTPCGTCQHYLMIAAAASSSFLYVGGAIVEFETGPVDGYTAWLARYSFADGTWAEVELPMASEVDQINDILVASNGDLYLGCGAIDAFMVRIPAGGTPELEWSETDTEIFGLGELADGTVLACGTVNKTGYPRTMIMERR